MFLALLSPYWICYSGILAIQYSQGSFSPSVTNRDSWGTFVKKIIMITFLGPIKIVLRQIWDAIGDVVVILAYIFSRFSKETTHKVREKFERTSA